MGGIYKNIHVYGLKVILFCSYLYYMCYIIYFTTEPDDSSNIGIAIGVSIGCLLLLALAITLCIIILLMKRNDKKKSNY